MKVHEAKARQVIKAFQTAAAVHFASGTLLGAVYGAALHYTRRCVWRGGDYHVKDV